MLDFLDRREKILISFKNGLTNKGHSFKELAGVNSRLDLIKEIKCKYNTDIITDLIGLTNYSLLLSVKHGEDNISAINKRKQDYYLYAVNMNDVSGKDTKVLRKSFLSRDTLIYESEKSINGNPTVFYVIFSKEKYDGSHQYIANKWQGK